MRFRTYFLFLLSLLLLNGCVSLGFRGDMSTANREKIGSLGVVSMLGDNFKSIYIATTVFGNDSHVFNASSWKIDELATDVAIDTIKSLGPYDAKKLEANFTNIDVAISAARRDGHDALVAIVPRRYDNAPHYAGGYGFYRAKVFGLQKDCIYSLFVVSIYSATTGQRIGWEWSFPVMDGIQCSGLDQEGRSWTRSMEWKENSSEYTEAEVERFRKDVVDSVRRNIVFSLNNIGL